MWVRKMQHLLIKNTILVRRDLDGLESKSLICIVIIQRTAELQTRQLSSS